MTLSGFFFSPGFCSSPWRLCFSGLNSFSIFSLSTPPFPFYKYQMIKLPQSGSGSYSTAHFWYSVWTTFVSKTVGFPEQLFFMLGAATFDFCLSHHLLITAFILTSSVVWVLFISPPGLNLVSLRSDLNVAWLHTSAGTLELYSCNAVIYHIQFNGSAPGNWIRGVEGLFFSCYEL